MNRRDFDTLELLASLGNTTTRSEFALRCNVGERSAERRIMQGIRSGILTSESRNGRLVYLPTIDGRRMHRAELARLAGDPPTPVPVLHDDIQRATEVTVLIHMTESRTA